jgi:outer membrane protein OmpA-like peptidoglycan-associated protein
MSDVLFDFNKYTLRPAAREKLAKISGIILSHPGLRLEVDGYTDSIGTDDYNLKLSQQRAGAVQGYLVTEGIAQDNVTALGFGKDNPVASNTTSSGRQMNRRVELVVSGEIIGTKIGPTHSSQ